MKGLQVGQRLQARQPGVADRRSAQHQGREAPQSCDVELTEVQLAQAGEQGALDDAAGDLLRLGDDQPGEGDAGDDDEEQGQDGDEGGREFGPRALSQPRVQRVEDDVEDGDADEAGGER